jgi:hypothetical protein
MDMDIGDTGGGDGDIDHGIGDGGILHGGQDIIIAHGIILQLTLVVVS